eukprot:scpid102272/ scgid29266/ 
MAANNNRQTKEVRRALKNGVVSLEANGRERPATLLRRLCGFLATSVRELLLASVGADAGRTGDSLPMTSKNVSPPQKRRREGKEFSHAAQEKKSCSHRRRAEQEERQQAHLAK